MGLGGVGAGPGRGGDGTGPGFGGTGEGSGTDSIVFIADPFRL